MFDTLQRRAAAGTAGVFRLDVANPRLPVAARLALVDALDPGPEQISLLSALSGEALDESSRVVVLQMWERVGAWVASRQQHAIVDVAGRERRGRDDWSAEEVAAALRLAPMTAGHRIAVARELCGRLAATGAELAAGRITYRHAAHLADALAQADDDVAARVQSAVLPRAGRQTMPLFRAAVARAIAAADPAGLQERHERAAVARDVTIWPEPDGIATLTATGPAPDVLAIFDRIASIAHVPHGAADDRLVGARRFDALVAAVAGGPAGAADAAGGIGSASGRTAGGGRVASRWQAGVLLDLATAIGLAEHPGEIPGYGPIPAALARRLAADADWHAWVLDAAKCSLAGLGTDKYRPSAALRRFVEARDTTCRFPGCRQPAWRCDVDHAVPHGDGGCTDPANCGCFCRRHHRLKHETNWKVEREPDGSVHWTSPLHQRHTVDPPDYRWMLAGPHVEPPPTNAEPAVRPGDDPPPF